MTRLTGAQSLIMSLEAQGVEVVFGVPGGAILPSYDPILDSPMRHVLARHEQGAGHMAEGYAMATGRPGVTLATSGPGATNLVTPLMNALMDSTPLVAVTGQVATSSIGTQAFQEAPTIDLTRSCTKANWLVEDPGDIPDVVAEAFRVATSGRPGPVLIDLPKDLQAAETEWRHVRAEPDPVPEVGRHLVEAAVQMIEGAERPVLYAGGGVIASGASRALHALAELARLPVVTTLMGRGAFPDQHPLALGMPGMHGTYTATTAMQRSDLLVAVGVRFDDRVTANPAFFAPHARVIHVDIDPSELGKIRRPELPIHGDARSVLESLLDAWGDRPAPARAEWLETLSSWQRDKPLRYHQPPGGPLKAQYIIEELHRLTEGEAIVVSGVGQHQMWASLHWGFNAPRTWINSGGLGTMGFALPAAIGAKVAHPDRLVYAIDGDGCFQMTMQELLTAAHEDIPVKIAVFNNSSYGMVRQWQDLFYGGRRSASDLGDRWPDYAGLAENLGCRGLKAQHPDEVGSVIEKSLAIDDRPVLVEFLVDPDEMVWPMVVAGGSNDEVLMGPEDLERRRR